MNIPALNPVDKYNSNLGILIIHSQISIVTVDMMTSSSQLPGWPKSLHRWPECFSTGPDKSRKRPEWRSTRWWPVREKTVFGHTGLRISIHVSGTLVELSLRKDEVVGLNTALAWVIFILLFLIFHKLCVLIGPLRKAHHNLLCESFLDLSNALPHDPPPGSLTVSSS